MNLQLGFALVSNVASDAKCNEICALVPSVPSRSGRRDLLANDGVAAEVRNLLLPVVEQVLGDGSIAVGATWFDKRPTRNWKVQWHQDLSVPAVGDPATVVIKDGIPHVQPAEDVLSALAIARLHLDPSNQETGGLAVVPSSHLRGRIPESNIATVVRELGVEHPICPTGSVLLMPSGGEMITTRTALLLVVLGVACRHGQPSIDLSQLLRLETISAPSEVRAGETN